MQPDPPRSTAGVNVTFNGADLVTFRLVAVIVLDLDLVPAPQVDAAVAAPLLVVALAVSQHPLRGEVRQSRAIGEIDFWRIRAR